MKDEERQCPNCGHDVLNWDVMCPGCDQVPWDSPAGRRIMQGRRQRHFWITGGPMVALLVLAGAAVIIGNIHFSRTTKWTQEASNLGQLIERASWLQGMLEDAQVGTTEYEDVEAAARQWLMDDLPEVITIIEDEAVSSRGRSTAAVSVGKLLGGSTRFAELAEGQRQPVVDALTPLLSDPDDAVRVAARLALEGLGVDPD